MINDELKRIWASGPIVSRLFLDADIVEEIVAGHTDKVFVLKRRTERSFELIEVRPRVMTPEVPEQPKTKKGRYAQYE